MDGKTVDIVMATYNGEKYVGDQIDSILNQTYSNFRLLISDDCSTDATLSILEEYERRDKRIKIVSKGVRYGSAVKNFVNAIGFVESDYIAFSDQDDVWKPNKISKMMDVILAEEGAGVVPVLVYSDLTVVDEYLNEICDSYFSYMKINPWRNQLSKILVQNVVTGCAMLCNKSLIVQAGINDAMVSSLTMHDHFFGVAAAALGKLIYIDESTVLYRQHGDNSVGASEYSLSKWAMMKNKNADSIRRSVDQAAACLKWFGSRLDYDKYIILEGYSNILKMNLPRRVVTLSKYGLWKSNASRRMGQLLYMATM